MNFKAFPTVFPADSASKIGQAILTKHFTTDLVEPIWDLIGFGLFKLFGSTENTPTPPVPVTGRTFGAGLHSEGDVESVGRMLSEAADSHRNMKALAETGQTASAAEIGPAALPWETILSVLFTVLQGLLAALSPSPIPSPAPSPAPAPAQK